MKTHCRYVDDESIVAKSIPKSEDGDTRKDDERTMLRLQEIANSIHPSIQLTVDYPSNNENGRIPILDTEQWIEEVNVGGVKKHQILHSHYSKPMANKLVIHRNSALSDNTKIAILVADLLRIMKNVSKLCSEQERNRKIQEFINRMQFSGYTKADRAYVYRKAKRKYDKCVEKDEAGETPMYRSKWWNVVGRREERKQKARWYEKDGSEATFFVNATPNGELAEECKNIFKKAGIKVKVIEKTGKTMKEMLVKSDPFREVKCNKANCEVCLLGDNVNCKARNVLYRMSCQGTNKNGSRCTNVHYDGETSRSIGERFKEHISKYQHQKPSVRKTSVFYDHVQKEHFGTNPTVKLEILAQFHGNAAMRQAAEAVTIRDEKPPLNGKEENTNQPRKRRDRNRNAVSDVN